MDRYWDQFQEFRSDLEKRIATDSKRCKGFVALMCAERAVQLFWSIGAIRGIDVRRVFEFADKLFAGLAGGAQEFDQDENALLSLCDDEWFSETVLGYQGSNAVAALAYAQRAAVTGAVGNVGDAVYSHYEVMSTFIEETLELQGVGVDAIETSVYEEERQRVVADLEFARTMDARPVTEMVAWRARNRFSCIPAFIG